MILFQDIFTPLCQNMFFSGVLFSPALKHLGQPALRGFAEALVHADSRFVHRANDDVKGDALRIPEETGQIAGVKSPPRGDRVALNARHLHQPANRVAGQAEVMFQGDFRRVLDLVGIMSEKIGQRRGGHGAGGAHLRLAAAFRTGNRGVPLDNIAKEPRYSQPVYDLLVG